MTYSRKIVLHTPNGLSGRIEALAREFIEDGVAFVACVGADCEVVEDLVDWVAVEAGSPEKNFILTSSHVDESLEEAVEFARSLTGDYEGEVQVVEA